ncbi:selenoprotein K-like [Pogonomyrmex barbatus]|uniref:Selenoprotein K-like n=1 Tax=Pogonomyrmex barbatus TaxID=144034 RepID=A0A6I9WBC3_9HYME|nr:selenoprotein K-like [Pogonomyrmex barbatus]
MVYITNDGDVMKSTPWGLKRVFAFFTGIIYMVIMFFQTLVNIGTNRSRNQYSRDYYPGSGSRPSTRRLGRPNTGNNVDIPFFGGCSSCTK